MTYEELKRYDRTVIKYRDVEGLLYLFGGFAYFLNNVLSGAAPDDGGRWKEYGYSYSWYITCGIYHHIKTSVDYNKLEEILCS